MRLLSNDLVIFATRFAVIDSARCEVANLRVT